MKRFIYLYHHLKIKFEFVMHYNTIMPYIIVCPFWDKTFLFQLYFHADSNLVIFENMKQNRNIHMFTFIRDLVRYFENQSQNKHVLQTCNKDFQLRYLQKLPKLTVHWSVIVYDDTFPPGMRGY